MMSECLFCKIIAGDIPAEKVYEDDHVIAFRDINPVAPTHVLVIPRTHIASLNDALPEHREALGAILLAAREVAKTEGLGERGYRLVVNTLKDAGQVVFHVHAHVIGGRPFEWPPG
jgi:histidine triad (HIT) family protein